ncbi:MAG: hypothetical protein RLN86_11245 [Cyclobacteriaceae bacterium]
MFRTIKSFKSAIILLIVFVLASGGLMVSCTSQEVVNQDAYILVTGRRLPYVYAISLEAALDPANHNTSNAIISRSKVALDRLDGQLLGDPANLLVSEDGSTLYVINHHGSIDNGEFRQHGGRGQIAVLDVDKVLDPNNNGSANALLRHMDSGGFGAIGAVLLLDMIIISNAENNLTEDGGNRIGFVDRRTGSLRITVELPLGSRTNAIGTIDCVDYPVPYVAPYGPPRNLAVLSSSPSFGCFPNPNGLAMGRASNGKRYLFTANGGTNDVSVIDLELALEGDRFAEIHRIANQLGAWGIAATPDKRHIIVAHGGNQQVDVSGNTISFINVDRASTGASDAEVARLLVGTDDPTVETHPLIPSVTPDGKELIIPNLLVDNVSIVNIELALAGDPGAEVARIPLSRSNGASVRPKGSVITADGKYAVISAGPGSQPYTQETGMVYVIELETRRVVGTVTGVGNDPYGLAVVYR